jgi:perosamine synthetase
MPSSSSLALCGGSPVGPVQIHPFPRFTETAIQRVTDLLRAGKTIGLNRGHVPEIGEAEAAISAYHGGRHVLGANSGHGALQMALAGLEIGPGDEVITTPYTWGASISCILHQGAIPVFADIDEATGLLDPAAVAAVITPRTKAILVVHLYGQPADLPAFRALADRHGLAMIEDGSQAHGATLHGVGVGNVGDAAGFSCMGGKLLATTEAGYLVTPHEEVYWKGALIGHHHGRRDDPGFPEHLRPYADSLVYTHRFHPLNAVLLVEQLKKLDVEVDQRRAHADRLRAALVSCRHFQLAPVAPGARPAYHLLTGTFNPEAAGISRNTFTAALTAEGLHAFAYVPVPIPDWPRMHWQDYAGPKVPWLDNFRRAGMDYRQLPLPSCRRRCERAVEMRFDFIDPDPTMVDRMAEIILKVEAGLDQLRAHEKTHGPAPLPKR